MKKLITLALALIMLVSLVACGTSGNNSGGNNNTVSTNSSETNSGAGETSGLAAASKDNYASLLKEFFGIDAKDIEEDGFEITDVRGDDTITQLTLTYKTAISDTFEAQESYQSKVFDVTKVIGGGSNYRANADAISDETYSSFADYKASDTDDWNTWFYKFNGKNIKIYVTAGSSVWIQLTERK